MNQIDTVDNKRRDEITNLVLVFIYRIPKKNHDSLIQLNDRVIGAFKKYGVLKFEVFQLGSTNDMMGFTNIAKTISAEPKDEEVWLEVQSYRDHNHFQEVGAKMMADEAIKEDGQQFFNLITPGSRCSFGEFSRVKDVGFS
ncbi:MAG TPA: DUF1428 family protein [Candidatus Sulfopaludibacter sp.]|jgi:uncharacterized protein YbaA (DUF1428 family)|nr:DUF1428 family protein [Candidatus Sulfopaludibacter sp.]